MAFSLHGSGLGYLLREMWKVRCMGVYRRGTKPPNSCRELGGRFFFWGGLRFYLFEGEHVHSGRKNSRLHNEHGAGRGTQSHNPEIVTRAEIKSQTFN